MNENTVLTYDNVCYYYKDGSRQVNILKDAHYQFEKGKIYAIVGASGSGKTTSLVLAGGLDEPKSGHILYKGEDISKIGLTKYRRNHVSIVFQSYNLITYMNALQNVMSAMEISHIKVHDKKKYAMDILKDLGLNEDECKRDIRKLSGGQQQRVAIARDIAKDFDLILCDEPTGNLDEETSQGIIETFVRLAHEKNLEALIDYMPHILMEKPEAKLVLVGAGPEEDALKERVQTLNLESVVLFPGAVPHEFVNQYYQMADLYVNLSTTETQGLTFLEAITNHLSIVAYASEYLQHLNGIAPVGRLVDTEAAFPEAVLDVAHHLPQAKASLSDLVSIVSSETFYESLYELYQSVEPRKSLVGHFKLLKY